MNLTVKHKGIAKRITSQVTIISIADGKSIPVMGVWDTGATNSMISITVAQKLKLINVGYAPVTHVGGVETYPMYIAGIEIDGGLKIEEILLTAMPNIHSFGMLIGMDIISRGKFCIENKNGNTVFSFSC